MRILSRASDLARLQARLVGRALSAADPYPPPSPYEAWFFSLAHDADTLEEAARALGEAAREARDR